jgi:peptidoglycan/LPS O-acetylase OafA/YrhL
VIKFFDFFYSGVPPFVFIVLAAGILSCLIGAVGYYLIERPSILLAKRLYTHNPKKSMKNFSWIGSGGE